jgi:hypothetical protein
MYIEPGYYSSYPNKDLASYSVNKFESITSDASALNDSQNKWDGVYESFFALFILLQ